VSILLLADPIFKNQAAFYFITVQSDVQSLVLSNPIKFSVDISQDYGDTIQSYNQKRVFSDLITLDDNNLSVNLSATFFVSLSI
jgi:hypothetical protein